jgi:hypothetical protein
LDERRPEYEGYVVGGEVVADGSASGMVASDDKEGVFITGKRPVGVDETSETVVGEETCRKEVGQSLVGGWEGQSASALFVLFLQFFVLQSQHFVHGHSGYKRKVGSGMWLVRECFQVPECVDEKGIVVVSPPIGDIVGWGSFKFFVERREVVNALSCEIFVDAVEVEVAGIVGACVVTG